MMNEIPLPLAVIYISTMAMKKPICTCSMHQSRAVSVSATGEGNVYIEEDQLLQGGDVPFVIDAVNDNRHVISLQRLIMI